MWAVQFFVYALIVWLLAMFLGGTLIGYYFAKKADFEAAKAKSFATAVEQLARKNAEN